MDENIIDIANKIRENGGNLYLVGGAVRDKLLNIEIFDEDYCVTGIDEQIFEQLFPKAKSIGRSFKVYQLDGKEFAMARKDVKKEAGHKGFEIIVGKDITIEEDLARRDITINSIAQDVLTGEYIDPFNGRKDLEKKLIKATTEAFLEDPLRAYRVARFATKLEFDIDENTIKLMNSLKSELNTLSKERVFTEFSKALSAKKPSIFFNTLRRADILDVHFKEIYKLIGALQPIEHHPEGDAYNHTMLVVDNCANQTEDLEIRFSALVHDLGKGLTPKEEYPHHYNHEEKGVKLVEELGNRICTPKRWIDCGKVACREHMRGGIFYKMKLSKKVDYIERISKSPIGLKGMQIVVNSDKLSSRNVDEGSMNFEKIGIELLNKINGKYIKEKYNIEEGIALKNKLREERIEYIKAN